MKMKNALIALLVLGTVITTKASSVPALYAYTEEVTPYSVNGHQYLYIRGWITGNGIRPFKDIKIDGIRRFYHDNSFVSGERHDVCDFLTSIGWTCDDGIEHTCQTGYAINPCLACVGYFALVDVQQYNLNPGTHTIQLCAEQFDGINSSNEFCDVNGRTFIVN